MSKINMSIDEKVKHRIIGAAVIIALFALIAPVLIKHNEAGDSERLANFTMPTPPVQPEVIITEEIHAFVPIEVAQVNIDDDAIVIEPITEIVKPTAEVKPITTKSTSGEWYVQLGSFSHHANASRLLQQLIQQGFAAQTETLNNSKGHRITRVIVGQYLTRESAVKLAEQLEQKIHIKGVIIRHRTE